MPGGRRSAAPVRQRACQCRVLPGCQKAPQIGVILSFGMGNATAGFLGYGSGAAASRAPIDDEEFGPSQATPDEIGRSPIDPPPRFKALRGPEKRFFVMCITSPGYLGILW